MVLLPDLTALRFSDSDAGDFLHNQLSADILALSPEQSTFACYCEPKGRVLALMLITRSADGYLVIMSRTLAATVAQRLRIYVMRAKVSIEVMEDVSIVGMHSGDERSASIESIADVAIPDSSNSFLITRDASTTDSSADGADQWKTSELRRGITWLCPETSGQFLPQMLGFDNIGAVNFRKGCYPGQEIVARTHYLGKVKRHPRFICTQSEMRPPPLDKIQIVCADQSYAAVVTDSSHLEDSGVCLFVVTRMGPDLVAEKIEYQGQEAELIKN